VRRATETTPTADATPQIRPTEPISRPRLNPAPSSAGHPFRIGLLLRFETSIDRLSKIVDLIAVLSASG
jgi:hypothetical protein